MSPITKRPTPEGEGEDRFHQVAESSHEFFWMTDASQTEVIYVSPGYEAILGRSCRSFYERPFSFLDAIHPADRERVEAAQKQKVEGEYQITYRIIRPDGAVRWLWSRTFPLVNEEGAVYRVAGITEDITERKHIGVELKRERDFALQVMNTMGQGLTVTNAEGKFEYVNQAYARLIGCELKALIGRSPLELTLVEDHGVLAEAMAQRLQGETTVYETRLRRADGNIAPVLITGTPRWQDGQMAGSIAVITDLTESKQAEDALRQMVSWQTTLNEVLRTVTGQQELEQVIGLAQQTIIQFADWPHTSIILLSEDQRQWVVRAPSPGSSFKQGQAFPIGRGIVGRAITTGQTQYVPDVTLDPEYVPDMASSQCKLAVPLRRGERVLGILSIESDRPDDFTADDILLAESLAGAVALALDNARLYGELHAYLADLGALYSVAQMTTHSLVADEVLKEAMLATLSSLAFEAGLVAIADAGDDRLRLVATHSFPAEGVELFQPEGMGTSLYVFIHQRRQTLVLPNLAQAKIPAIQPMVNALMAEGWHAFAGTPLLYQERSLGILCLFARRPLTSFTGTPALLMAIGHQVAVAATNARLHEAMSHEHHLTQALINSNRDGIVLVSLDRHILMINEKALALAQLDGRPTTWINRPLRELLAGLQKQTPAGAKAIIKEIKRIQRGDEPPGSGQYQTPPKTIYWQNLPVRLGESAMGRLIILRDATAHRLLERFVADSIARQALADPEVVRPGGEERTVTVLFADIRGYTAISGVREPVVLMDILNRYFAIISEIVAKRGGTINQYGGDMIMALFNAPEQQSDHALRAVRAGLGIQSALRILQERPENELYSIAEFGIGINTGTAAVGYLGYQNRVDYTAIGETTNVASRLSATSRGGEVLIGPQTYQAIHQQISTRPVGPLRLKGKIAPVMVYEALGEAS